MATGIDYYVAAAFEASGQATFWVRDLTNGGPMQTITVTHNLATALPNDTRFTIGDTHSGDWDFEIDVVMDEVRLSNRVRSASELLMQ